MTIHKRRTVLPGGIPTINWSNPLTAGLLACYVPAAHTGPRIYNLACSGGDLTLGAGATYIMTPEGQALNNTAADGGASGPCPTRWLASPYGSLYWRGYHTDTPTNTVALVGIQYTDSDIQPWEVFAIENRLGNILSANVQVNFSNFDATTSFNAYFAWDRGSYAATFDNTNGLEQLFKNGDRLNITINGGASGWIFINPTINLGYYSADNTRISNTYTLFGCIWNRVLTQGEVTAMDIDPYQFLVYPEDEILSLGVSNARQKQAFLDGILALMNRTKTASLDAILMKNRTATASLDSVLFKTAAKTANLGGILIRLSTATASLDARITQNKPFTTMDALIAKVIAKTASMDATFTMSTQLTATFSLSVQIPIAITAGMDALVYPAFASSPNRTAMIPDIPRDIDVE